MRFLCVRVRRVIAHAGEREGERERERERDEAPCPIRVTWIQVTCEDG